MPDPNSSPSSGPALEFPRTVTLGALRICIRPVTREDRERVLNGLRSISVRTSYHRFFTPSFYPNEEQLRYLTEVDGVRHVALGAVDCTEAGEPGVGVARYVRLPESPAIAEAAVLVVDAYQGQGVGSVLLAALSRHGAAHGVERFRAYVMEDNKPFLNSLKRLGAVDERVQDGVVQIDLPTCADASDVPATASERARWAWQRLDASAPGSC